MPLTSTKDFTSMQRFGEHTTLTILAGKGCSDNPLGAQTATSSVHTVRSVTISTGDISRPAHSSPLSMLTFTLMDSGSMVPCCLWISMRIPKNPGSPTWAGKPATPGVLAKRLRFCRPCKPFGSTNTKSRISLSRLMPWRSLASLSLSLVRMRATITSLLTPALGPNGRIGFLAFSVTKAS